MQVHIIGQLWQEGIISLALAALGGILMWPIRKIKTAYKELQDAINSTHAELVLQRSNCLTTLSNQGEKQIELLSKTVETLEAMHLDQRLLLGRLDK
jgi:hypothetical protein